MISSKLITTQLNLTCQRMYEADIDAVCLDCLREIFVGRNYAGVHILSIDTIVSRSAQLICDITMDGRSEVTVRFTATVLEYSSGHVIPDCKIIKTASTEKLMHGISNKAAIQLIVESWAAPYYSLGVTMPVVVKVAECSLNEQLISVIASPFMTTTTPLHVYEIRHAIDDRKRSVSAPYGALADQDGSLAHPRGDAPEGDDRKRQEYVMPLGALAQFEERKLVGDKKQLHEFFVALLRVSPVPDDFTTVYSDFKFLPLAELPTKAAGFVCIPDELDKSRRGVYFAESLRDDKLLKSRASRSRTDIASICEVAFADYQKYLINLFGLVDHFKSFAEVSKHVKYWQLYQAHRLESWKRRHKLA